jgi:hypothetical protein
MSDFQGLALAILFLTVALIANSWVLDRRIAALESVASEALNWKKRIVRL